VASLSIIVIARNEEVRILQCLQSLKNAAAEVGGAEIILIDSASTDRTVEIARSYGVRVVSLNSNWDLSASAGRFVGFHKTNGELVMFVDADSVIDRHWFRTSIPYFRQSEVAGVMGYLRDFDAQGQELSYVGHRITRVVTSPWLRGIGIYRRRAMDEVGTFNPYLTEEEEAELAFRLRRRGWQLLNVPHKMGDHLRGATLTDYLRRKIHYRRFAPIGRTLRYAVSAGNGMLFVFERLRPMIRFAIGTLVLLVGITLSFLGHRLVEGVTLATFGTAFLWISTKRRTLLGPVLYFAQNSLTLYGLIVGFLTTKIKDPRNYPLDAVEVSAAQPTNGLSAVG
jgi:glycosyltransferase involved in cell wall biosynthesis